MSKLRYISVCESPTQHHVVVVHEDQPTLWRLIATFPTEYRADAYADIENELLDDPNDSPNGWRPDTKDMGSIEAPPEPRSSIKIEHFSGQRVTITASRPGIDAAPMMEMAPKPKEDDEDDDPPVERAPDEDEPEPLRVAPLPAPAIRAEPRPWSDDIDLLAKLYIEGKTDEQIAEAMPHRTLAAVRTKVSTLRSAGELPRERGRPAKPPPSRAPQTAPKPKPQGGHRAGWVHLGTADSTAIWHAVADLHDHGITDVSTMAISDAVDLVGDRFFDELKRVIAQGNIERNPYGTGYRLLLHPDPKKPNPISAAPKAVPVVPTGPMRDVTASLMGDPVR